MKHIKKFTTHAEYEAYMGGGDAYLPNVSACDDDAANVVHYNPYVEPSIPSNEIWYTTTTNETIDPSEYYEGVAVVSNTYDGKKCIMRFEEDITDVTELFDNDGREEDETQLLTVQLPNAVENIGEYAFWNCNGLTSATIPNSVTSIGDYAFQKCRVLTSITIPNSVASIGEYSFHFCDRLTTIVIGSGLTIIGENAFQDCYSLTSVTIGNSLTSIGGSAFEGCINLTSATIPNSVTSIGYKAFFTCRSLTSVTIPNSVTSIGQHAFYGCSGLATMTVEATTPPTLGDTNAISTATTTIYVPYESVDAYKTASNWSSFADIIQPIS